jgi:hypothetical protein
MIRLQPAVESSETQVQALQVQVHTLLENIDAVGNAILDPRIGIMREALRCTLSKLREMQSRNEEIKSMLSTMQ